MIMMNIRKDVTTLIGVWFATDLLRKSMFNLTIIAVLYGRGGGGGFLSHDILCDVTYLSLVVCSV